MSEQFKLTKRLSFILDQMPDSAELWDVGCDHGLLGLAAVERGRTKQVHLVDPAIQVIQNLKAVLNSPKCKEWWSENEARVRFHHARGEDVLPEASGAIVIAGMGGETMIAILEKLQRFEVLVLNPLTHFEEVEEFLRQRSWAKKNASIKDRGILYKVYAITQP